MAASWTASAQQTTFISPAVVGNPPPNVNATNFINSGVWNIATASPYRTFSTYNYTNTGTMIGSVGWQFDHGPYPNGPRDWSANFFNDNSGVITASDGFFVAGSSIYTASFLLVSATNIVNKGTLEAGPYGQIVLNGSGVNLSRSGLKITPIQGGGSLPIGLTNVTIGFTNFIPDVGIYDEYWSGGTNAHSFAGPTIWDGQSVGGSSFPVGIPCAGNGFRSIGPLSPTASGYLTNVYGNFQLITTNLDLSWTTNQLYSNTVHQAVFVYVGDPNITAAVGFSAPISTNLFRAMVAQLAATSTNVVSQTLQTDYIYVEDDLAAYVTNGALALNLSLDPAANCTSPTYRPDSVNIGRLPSRGYGGGSGSIVPGNFFYDASTFSNSFSIGRADAYSARVDNLAQEPIPGNDLSTAPGKIIINAKDLNLSKVRISSGVEVLIQASNLVSSAGAIIDCQNLSYDIGSTNGYLDVTNLTTSYVQRLHGTVSEWSGVWTNYLYSVYDNYVTNAAATNAPFYTNGPITVVTEMDLAITVVDAGGLGTTIPVTVQNLILRSTNMVVSDNLTMSTNSTLRFDGLSLTINGSLALTNPVKGWSSANASKLRYFTNNGTLSIPNVAHFGDDTATSYAAFVNNGTIGAGSQYINSTLFLGGGTETVSGSFALTTQSGAVQNGTIKAGSQIQFYAGNLKLNQATIAAGGQLYFSVTGALFDAGIISSNVLTCTNGFDLAIKPAAGDLLGTKLVTTTPLFASVSHFWSGLDLGAFPAGYNNNTAVGQLVLKEGGGSQFIFSATTSSNALYADLLDLSLCPDFLDPDTLTIDPNFVIYYAAVKLPPGFTVPPNTNGIAQQPEEYLNGLFGGHLRWVSSFAGPNSSVDVLINGQTVQVNKALRLSKIIDSNGNGIPNFYDLNPFDAPPVVVSGAVVTNNPPPASKFAISWTAVSGVGYQVQYSTNLSPTVWTPLQNYTNFNPSSMVVTVYDTNSAAGRRFYRVSRP